MKAEERKHLETNTLADGLGKLAQGLQQGLPRNLWLVAALVVVVLALYVTWNYFSRRAQDINARLWTRWDQLDGTNEIDSYLNSKQEETKRLKEILAQPRMDLGQVMTNLDMQRLEAFVKDNSSTVQGRMARFQLARLYLYEGEKNLGRTNPPVRNNARKKLEEAARLYAELIKEARDIPVLHQEALLNCGKARESLGETSEAEKLYEELAKTYPKTELGKVGAEQVERLKSNQNLIEKLNKDLKELPEPTPLPPRS